MRVYSVAQQKVIDVPDGQTSAVTSTPQAPQQNILQKILGFVAPATTRGIENQYSTIKQAQENFAQGGGYVNYLKDILPTLNPLSADKLKSGAEMASYLIPFGKGAGIASKFFAPGAAVGALQGLSKENVTPGGLATDTALGAGGAGVLGLLGKAVAPLGKVLGRGGESLATKSLKPSPSQQVNFFKETGEKLGEYLQNKGLQGANYEKINSFVEPLQNQFDEVVTNQGLKVKAGSVFSDLTKTAEKLLKSTIPSDKEKGKVIKTIAKSFQNTYGNKALGADVVTALRRTVDDNVKKFALDESTKGPLQVYRDALQKSVQEVADKTGVTIGDQTLKETGIELSKLYKVLGIAEKQQFLGGGANPLGLTGLLGAGVGGGLGGLPGAAAGVLATKAINSPQVIGAASKGATAIGSGLENATVNPLLKQIFGQVSSRGGGLIPTSPTNQQENYNQSNQFAPSPESIAQPVNKNQISEDQMRQVLLSTKISDKTKKNILAAYKLQSTGKSTKLSEPQQAGVDAQRLSDLALKQLQAGGVKTGPILPRLEEIYSIVNRGDQTTLEFNNSIAQIKATIAKARGGTSFTPNEEKLLNKYTPNLGDSQQQLEVKLKGLVEFFKDRNGMAESSSLDQITNLLQ